MLMSNIYFVNATSICMWQKSNFCNFPFFWSDFVPTGNSGGVQVRIPFSTTRITGIVDGLYWITTP